jgi:hypothetical protein
MNQPSEATKLKMAAFFLKTSIPRILAKERGMEIIDKPNSTLVSLTKREGINT